MRIYIVASNTAFTVVCRAKNKKHALQIAFAEYFESHGVMPCDMENDFTVYEAHRYLAEEPLVIYED